MLKKIGLVLGGLFASGCASLMNSGRRNYDGIGGTVARTLTYRQCHPGGARTRSNLHDYRHLVRRLHT